MAQEKHPIRNGLIVAFVGGVLVSFIPLLRSLAYHLFNSLWHAIKFVWAMFSASYALPGWLIVSFVLLCIGLVITIVSFGIGIRKSGSQQFAKYSEDQIYGVKWRWRWFGNSIADLWCFCPNCDATLVYNDSDARALVHYSTPETKFICENCNHSVVGSVPGGDKAYAIGAVKREIDRRVRTGERRYT